MTELSLETTLRNRLERFLHTGNEVPKYFPGCWSSHKYFEVDRLQALNEVFAQGANNEEPVKIITKAYKDGSYTRYEAIAFALTKCILLGSPAVKQAAYNAAAEICTTPEQLMIFTKYTRLLKTGNGQGWCRTIREWYIRREPMDLAREITRVRSRHGRSHKTLLRKSHVKVPENKHGHDAAVKYAIFGLKRAKQLLSEAEGVKEVFEYLQKVEDMRHCEDPNAAALIASTNHFTIDHVPGHLLTSQEVWDAILPQFSLEELLYNIQRIHNMGFLTAESTTTAILVSLLNNQEYIKKSKIHPLAVYIALANYKKKSPPMKHEKAKAAAEKEQRRRQRQIFDSKTGQWEWNVARRHPKEVKHWGIDQPPSPIVLAALTKLVDQTWALTPATKARYLITLDMRPHMFKGRHFCKSFLIPKKGKKAVVKSTPTAAGDGDTEKKSKKHQVAECFYNKHVTPGHAAIILALQILKREKKADLAVFTEEGVQLLSIDRHHSSIDDTEYTLRRANLGRVQLDAPIVYAQKTNKKYDVFINMVDRTTRYMELDVKARGGRGPGGRFGPPPASADVTDHCPVRALYRYRAQSGVKDAKLIVVSLASHRVGTTDGAHEGVLDVVGVDEHAPTVLDAFARGLFK